MTEELSFEDYCRNKKIDPDLFLKAEPQRYKEWKFLFEQVHPDSFTEQKKFLLNPTRKQYLLIHPQETTVTNQEVKPKTAVKIPPFKKS